MAISIIAEFVIFIPHLQRLLSMFERISILFDRKMIAISAPNEIFFQARHQLWRGTPSTDLSKRISCNYCNLVAFQLSRGTKEFTSNGEFGITWLGRDYLIG